MGPYDGIVFTDEMVLDAVREEVSSVFGAMERGIAIPSYLCVLMTEDGVEFGKGMIVYQWNNAEDKYSQVHHSGHLVVKQLDPLLPICAVMVAEAWTVHKSLDGEDDGKAEEEIAELQISGKSLADHPERGECFVVQALTWDGRTCNAVIPFDRMDDGRLVVIQDDVVHANEVRRLDHGEIVKEAALLAEFYKGVIEEVSKRNE